MDFFFQWLGGFFLVFVGVEFVKAAVLYKENRKPVLKFILERMRDFFTLIGIVTFLLVIYQALTGQI